MKEEREREEAFKRRRLSREEEKKGASVPEAEYKRRAFKLSPDSMFEVRCIVGQYVYMQLVDNDIKDTYNGLVFKVKFQHMGSKRE